MSDADTELPSVDDTKDPLKKPEGPHPFWQDLNPDFLKGENYGDQGPHPEKDARNTAYAVKDVHDTLGGEFEDDDLKRIPIMPSGSRLEQGATYIDLRAPARTEFTATGNMVTGEHNRYVPKSDVPYWLWNRLIGVTQAERLDR